MVGRLRCLFVACRPPHDLDECAGRGAGKGRSSSRRALWRRGPPRRAASRCCRGCAPWQDPNHVNPENDLPGALRASSLSTSTMALPMLAGTADCGPLNPLQGLSKELDRDRGLQQVRLSCDPQRRIYVSSAGSVSSPARWLLQAGLSRLRPSLFPPLTAAHRRSARSTPPPPRPTTMLPASSLPGPPQAPRRSAPPRTTSLPSTPRCPPSRHRAPFNLHPRPPPPHGPPISCSCSRPQRTLRASAQTQSRNRHRAARPPRWTRGCSTARSKVSHEAANAPRAAPDPREQPARSGCLPPSDFPRLWGPCRISPRQRPPPPRRSSSRLHVSTVRAVALAGARG